MKTNAPCRSALILRASSLDAALTDPLTTALTARLAPRVEQRTVPFDTPCDTHGGHDLAVAVLAPGSADDPAVLRDLTSFAGRIRTRVACIWAPGGAADDGSAPGAHQLASLGWTVIPPVVAQRDISGNRWELLPPLSDVVLPTVWRAVMRSLRASYWDEAVAEEPRVPTPATVRGPLAPVDVLITQRQGGGGR